MNILPNSAGGQEGDVGGGGEQLRRAALEPPDPRRGAHVLLRHGGRRHQRGTLVLLCSLQIFVDHHNTYLHIFRGTSTSSTWRWTPSGTSRRTTTSPGTEAVPQSLKTTATPWSRRSPTPPRSTLYQSGCYTLENYLTFDLHSLYMYGRNSPPWPEKARIRYHKT